MKRAVLIGVGMVADTHLAALKDADDVMLHGIMGRYPEKARAFVEKATDLLDHRVIEYADVEAVAADADVDFVILTTPPDARLAIVQTLADAGKPILMEKPLERTYQAALDLVEICESAAVPLGVVFQHRTRDVCLRLKHAVESAELGRIACAEIRVPWWRDQSYYDAPGRGTYARDGGGVMITQAIHTLDLALWVLGPFRKVQAMMRRTPLHRLEAEDWAGMLFETQLGCVGTMVATTAAFPGESEALILHGSSGSAHLKAGCLTLHPHDGEGQVFGALASSGGGANPMNFTHGWHQNIICGFAAHLTDPRSAIITGRDALQSHAVIDAMEASNRTGTWAEVVHRDG